MVQINHIPVVTIVTRHSADCPFVGEEGYKRCGCWKHLRYRENGKPRWLATKERTWAGAERFKTNFLLQRDPAHAHLAAAQARAQVTVRDAILAFLKDKKGEDINEKTYGAYDLQLNRFLDYLDAAGVVLLECVALPHLSSFRAAWPKLYPAPGSRYLVQARLQTFFAYATRAYRLAYNPMADLSPIKPQHVQTKPFEPDEYKRLLAALPALFTGERAERGRIRQHLHALIELMRHSGLAIQDALCLPRTSLVKDASGYRVVTHRVKTKVRVSVPIPPAVAARLLAVHSGHADYFFWDGKIQRDSLVHKIQAHLRQVFARAGMPKAHSHMLRDTAAVEWLKAGLTLFEVSKLLGHNPATTAKYYAPWVQGLQDNMEAKIRANWKAALKKEFLQ